MPPDEIDVQGAIEALRTLENDNRAARRLIERDLEEDHMDRLDEDEDDEVVGLPLGESAVLMGSVTREELDANSAHDRLETISPGPAPLTRGPLDLQVEAVPHETAVPPTDLAELGEISRRFVALSEQERLDVLGDPEQAETVLNAVLEAAGPGGFGSQVSATPGLSIRRFWRTTDARENYHLHQVELTYRVGERMLEFTLIRRGQDRWRFPTSSFEDTASYGQQRGRQRRVHAPANTEQSSDTRTRRFVLIPGHVLWSDGRSLYQTPHTPRNGVYIGTVRTTPGGVPYVHTEAHDLRARNMVPPVVMETKKRGRFQDI